MRLTVRADRGWTVVDVDGVVDVATAPELRSRLQELQIGNAARVLVDLDRVELLDSFGLGVLVGARKRARTSGGALALVVTRERLRHVLEMTGLDAVFTVAGTADEVLGA